MRLHLHVSLPLFQNASEKVANPPVHSPKKQASEAFEHHSWGKAAKKGGNPFRTNNGRSHCQNARRRSRRVRFDTRVDHIYRVSHNCCSHSRRAAYPSGLGGTQFRGGRRITVIATPIFASVAVCIPMGHVATVSTSLETSLSLRAAHPLVEKAGLLKEAHLDGGEGDVTCHVRAPSDIETTDSLRLSYGTDRTQPTRIHSSDRPLFNCIRGHVHHRSWKCCCDRGWKHREGLTQTQFLCQQVFHRLIDCKECSIAWTCTCDQDREKATI
mmetsp:Transcript_14831/g.20788  ORF Transcript_14831/g.20788 Transcript_14831/m.20788 type:complete len:270 (+) Transcript_14831:201-1010(+)